LVFKSTDDTLAGVLGFNVRDSIYLALLTKFSVTREELPKHLDKFEMLLENISGPRAAKVLYRAIAKRLYSELKLTFVADPKLGLREYVEQAKSRLLKTNPRTAEKLDTEIRARNESKASEDEGCN